MRVEDQEEGHTVMAKKVCLLKATERMIAINTWLVRFPRGLWK